MSESVSSHRGGTGNGLQVGDEGVIIYNRRGDDIKAVVVKVGRKWATVRCDRGKWQPEERCDRYTGRLDGGRYESPGVFLTPEAYAHRERMFEASRIIEGQGLSFRLGARWKDADALALADWLVCYFGGGTDG